MTEHIVHTYEN